MVGSTIGRYRLISRIGRGGYATVWRAQDPLLGRDVAIKVLNEDLASSPIARRRFLHEAQSAAALDHPGIVAVYDSGESDGTVYIALSLIDGETLSDRAARRLLPFEEAVRIVAAAADALDHAHQRGVIHRDVTGRNIMIAGDGRVVVLDFGLALATWESRLTSTQTTLGTAPYMAPEVMRGSDADVRSDLYGLGTVFYEALTGTLPFPGGQAQTWFYLVMNTDPVPLHTYRPEVPPALEAVVMKAIARDPDLRYQTAAAFREALQAVPEATTHLASAGTVPTDVNGSVSAESTTTGPSRVSRAPVYLAVLPFDSEGPASDPDGACSALAGRLPETLRSTVSRFPGIRVVPVSRTDHQPASREVARELGANALLTGSVRRSGSRMRVAFSVVDPWRNVLLGGDVVDGSAIHTFDIEDEVVARVSGALGLTHTGPVLRTTRPHDPAANERYRQALRYLRSFDNEASVDGAITLLERLIASEGETAVYQAALARALLYKHRLTRERVWENRAAGACQRAQELKPDLAETWLAIGHLRSTRGQHEAALVEFSRVLANEPESMDALLGAARAHRDLGRFEAAAEIGLRAVAADPADWRGQYVLGWIYSRWGHYEQALGPFRRVVELTGDSARGQRDLGTAYYRLDRLDEAVEAYRASIAIEPHDEAYSNLGTALYYLDRCDEAIAALRKATELAPLEPIRWGNLGNACHWIEGREDEARSALDRAIGLMQERLEGNSGMAEGWARLAGWLGNRGRREEAAHAIEHALELAPEDVRCMVHAGRVYHQLGDRDSSLRWFGNARRAGCAVGDLMRSRELAALREDPEFRSLLEAPAAPGDSTKTAGQATRSPAGPREVG